MNTKKLINLLKKNEGTKLDFKRDIDINMESGKKELAKDICAIANSKGGRGYLILGIEDKTKNIIGIDSNKINEERLQQIITSRLEPPIPISLSFINIDNKIIGIITIYNGTQKPYQTKENGAFYIRRGSTTDTMRKQEIISSLQDNFNFNTETCPIPKSNINHLNNTLIAEYFKEHGIEINDENRLTLLENTSIISKDEDIYMCTLGGLLVFSDINSIYLPHNIIKIIDRTNNEKDIIIKGNLLSILKRCKNIIENILPPKYPIKAINEGIQNAIIHRDYTMIFKEIKVIISYNSIIIISPGNLLKKNTYGKINYVKRNMWIYEKLITLDSKEGNLQSIGGLKYIQKLFKNTGGIKFINSFKDSEFKIIYPGIKKFR